MRSWHITIVGVGGFGITWVLDRVIPDASPQLLYTVAGVSALLVLSPAFAWGYGRFINQQHDELKPLLWLRDEAMKRGWDFTSGTSLDVLDFIHGLRQAGSDGEIRFRGRPVQYDSEELNRKAMFENIPENHFKGYNIESTGLVSHIVGNPVPTDNFYVQTHDLGKRGLSDLHVDRAEALRWLKRAAGRYKGMHERKKASRD